VTDTILIMRFETKAIHAGGEPDEATGAIAPPIHLSTTYERMAGGQTPRGYGYIREANPTQTRLEAALASIDGGEAALAFASGVAAGAAILQSLPRGAHVILPSDSYYGFRAMAVDFFEKWGLTYDLVETDDLRSVGEAIRATTRIVWAESPSNPLMTIADLPGIAELTRAHGVLFVVDGTFATPALQRPLELGADVVLHSTTKYLGGHSDVQGGSLAFRRRDAFFESVLKTRKVLGAVASPFNSWLVLRGIRSLAARMRVHSANAGEVAAFLATHPSVRVVYYPGLPSHPGHAVAARQMSGFGGTLSFEIRGSRSDAIAVVERARLFTRATSLGGVESLIEHRASTEGPGSTTPPSLIRLSVGLEHPQDLIDDLTQAME
jgi:cystathionine gamma-synthase